MKLFKKLLLVCLILTLSGCGATKTAIQKHDLNVETKMSDAVILEPMAPSERIVYVKMRDATGNNLRRPMQNMIKEKLKAEGIQVTTNPKKANLMLTGTILQAGRTTKEDAYSSLEAGFSGAVLGAGAAAVAGANAATIGGLGLAGAAAGFLADTLVEDVYYSFIVDVELRERPLEGDEYSNSAHTAAKSGTSTTVTSTVKRSKNYNWIIYKTRIVTIANQVNLKFNEALPVVEDKTSNSLVDCMI